MLSKTLFITVNLLTSTKATMDEARSGLLELTQPFAPVEAGGCAAQPCQNGKQCYDIGQDDYECICEEFAGKNCQIPPPGVDCQASRIQVEIDRSWLIEKVQSDNHAYIYMGNGQSQNPACQAQISQNDSTKIHVTLDKNFRQCGTDVTRGDNGDYVYTNKVFFNLQNAGVQMAMAALVQWTCEYEDEYTVSSNPMDGYYMKDDRAKAKSIVGDFNLATQGYLRPTFEAKDLLPSYVVSGSTEIFHVLSNNKKWLSFQTQLTGEAQARDTKISLQKCFISSSRSPSNRPDEIETVIDHYCPVNTAFTKVYSNGHGNNGQFATNILAMRRNWMQEKPFYFHCEVRVCPDGEVCPTSCDDDASNNGGTEPQYEPLIVYSTTGPYFWQESPALLRASQLEATLEGEDAEHTYTGSLVADNSGPAEKFEPEVMTGSAGEDDFPLFAALALVSLLAVLVLSALITLYQRRGQGEKERKIHRNATPINMNFAHEGSLRRTRTGAAEAAMNQGRAGYETVTTLSGRIQHLPGTRPAAVRLNYV